MKALSSENQTSFNRTQYPIRMMPDRFAWNKARTHELLGAPCYSFRTIARTAAAMTRYTITPLPGFTPTIGRLVGMLSYARQTLLEAVDGLTLEELDHLQDSASNTIGALLAHVAAVERWYQVLTFEGRNPSASEEAAWAAAMDLGEKGRREIRGRELASYLDDLERIRTMTLAALGERDDLWLESPLTARPEMNAHWGWFHVAEDEISHRGQIRWLRARLHR